MADTVAILEEADREDEHAAREGRGRFGALVRAFFAAGLPADTVMYSDERCGEAEHRLNQADAVLVFVNPVHNGQDRSVLDPMLERVARRGTLVSAHPTAIEQMGTKRVLVDTEAMTWSLGDAHHLDGGPTSLPAFQRRLQEGPRVLKQVRGNGGAGVWRLTWMSGDAGASTVHVLRATDREGGAVMPWAAFQATMEQYWAGGTWVDQPYRRPSPDGMVRCYLSGETVAGFGHQRVGALTAGPGEQPMPSTPRQYSPPTDPRFQGLRARMEREWVPALLDAVHLDADDLPVIWDADFFWDRPARGPERFGLCEINASAVHPYPDAAISPMVAATQQRLSSAARA